ncbi:MAG TPA: hypothetical protein VL986_09675 [Terracidiphilus sp.]|nr:hypothetical protein [Terracidiphilus sp.]
MSHKLIGLAQKHLRRPILPQLAAQAALHRNRLEWEFADSGWHIAAAALAGHHERLSVSRTWKHVAMIGEYMAKIQCLAKMPLLPKWANLSELRPAPGS